MHHVWDAFGRSLRQRQIYVVVRLGAAKIKISRTLLTQPGNNSKDRLERGGQGKLTSRRAQARPARNYVKSSALVSSAKSRENPELGWPTRNY